MVKPSNCLVESLLLGKLLNLVRQIAAHSEAMLYARVKEDLPGLLSRLKYLLGLVAPLIGKDMVDLGRCDGQRPAQHSELVLAHEAGMGYVADLDPICVMAHKVL